MQEKFKKKVYFSDFRIAPSGLAYASGTNEKASDICVSGLEFYVTVPNGATITTLNDYYSKKQKRKNRGMMNNLNKDLILKKELKM